MFLSHLLHYTITHLKCICIYALLEISRILISLLLHLCNAIFFFNMIAKIFFLCFEKEIRLRT